MNDPKISPLSFEWDESNKDKNWIKHKVEQKESEEIFFNRPLVTFPDAKHSLVEKRYLSFGNTNKSRKLTIIFTLRNSIIRIISARDMSRKERNIYEKCK
jgi:uncharacterized protein